MNGKHYLVNFYECRDVVEMDFFEFCKAVCVYEGLTVVGESYHQFSPEGITFAVLLAESHLSVHTWPEMHSVAFDLYVCNHSRDNSAIAARVYQRVKKYLKSQREDFRLVERDRLSSTK